MIDPYDGDDAVEVGAAVLSLSGRWLDVGPLAAAALDRSPEDLTGMSLDELVHPDEHPAASAFLRHLRLGAPGVALTARFRTRSGGYSPARLTAMLSPGRRGDRPFAACAVQVLPPRAWRLADGKVELTPATPPGSDPSNGGLQERQMAALQEADERIRKSEARFRLMVEGSEQVFFYEHGVDHRFTYLSPSVQAILGYDVTDLLGQAYDVILAGGEVDEEVHRITESALHSGIRADTYMAATRRKDGRVVLLEVVESPLIRDGVVCGMQGFGRDVTERQRAEASLAESEARFRQLAENIPQVVWLRTLDSRLLYVSPAFGEVWGRVVEELEEASALWADSLHAADREEVLRLFGEGLSEPFEISYRIVRPDGSVRWVRDRGFPIHDGSSPPERFAGIAEDISRDVEADLALRRSEDRWRSLVENSADLLFVVGADATIEYVAPAVERVLGYAAADLIGREPFGLMHPDDAAAARATFTHVAQQPGMAFHREVRYRHKNGTWRILEVHGRNLLADPAVGGIVINSHDITEQRRAEAQFLQAQKMEAIGRLAGGVAHDFNNLLTSIEGFVQMAADEIGPAHPSWPDLDQAIRSARRAAELTRQLLAFSRQQVLKPRVLNLNESVREAKTMLERIVGEDIDLRLDLAADVGNVTADPVQIQQVLMNLVVNARHAMPDGGRLTLNTVNVDVVHDVADKQEAIQPGPYVVLGVTDTGQGMTKDVQERIFEPFFTTKEQGAGTGLGLSTVFGIVKQTGGYIWLYSEPGEGSAFKIYLPRTDAASEAAPPEAVPLPPARGDGVTVMVVEDEHAVREFASRVLRRHGCTVLQAADGQEALDLMEDRDGRIDVVFTDVVMPRVGGFELAGRIRTRYPDVQIVFASGYAREEVVSRGRAANEHHVLEKPYSSADLLAAVHSALQQTSG